MITIVPHQSEWPAEFSSLGREVRKVLGNVALRIDHIGSTAVSGLPAKDVIDIQVSVASFDPWIEEALSRVGYSRLAHISRDHIPRAGRGKTKIGRNGSSRALRSSAR